MPKTHPTQLFGWGRRRQVMAFSAAAFICLHLTPALWAGAVQDPEALHAIAQDFLQRTVKQRLGGATSVTVAVPDRRLRLAECDRVIEAFLPPSARLVGPTSVGVRCSGAKPWTIYLRGRVTVWETVVVAVRALPRGGVVSEQDVRLRKTDVSRLHSGYFRKLDQALGMSVSRSLAPGVVLSPPMLKRPIAVQRGDTVVLVAGGEQLEVRASARALADGAIGDRIRVENVLSRRRLQGVVVARGMVRAQGAL